MLEFCKKKPVWIFSDGANVLVAAVAAIGVTVAEKVPELLCPNEEN